MLSLLDKSKFGICGARRSRGAIDSARATEQMGATKRPKELQRGADLPTVPQLGRRGSGPHRSAGTGDAQRASDDGLGDAAPQPSVTTSFLRDRVVYLPGSPALTPGGDSARREAGAATGTREDGAGADGSPLQRQHGDQALTALRAEQSAPRAPLPRVPAVQRAATSPAQAAQAAPRRSSGVLSKLGSTLTKRSRQLSVAEAASPPLAPPKPGAKRAAWRSGSAQPIIAAGSVSARAAVAPATARPKAVILASERAVSLAALGLVAEARAPAPDEEATARSSSAQEATSPSEGAPAGPPPTQAAGPPRLLANATSDHWRPGDILRAAHPAHTLVDVPAGFALPLLVIPVPPTHNSLYYIYSYQLLDERTCVWMMREAEAQARRSGWTHGRHKSYPTVDQPVASVPAVATFVDTLLRSQVFPFLAHQFGFHSSELWLQDLFLVKYEHGTTDGQTHLAMHRDGSLLTFNVLLSDPSDFSGGHTKFELLDRTVPMGRGCLVAHCGKLRHMGVHITRGTRYILVGFVNVTSRRINPTLVNNEHAYWHTSSTKVSDLWLMQNALLETADM